MLLKSREMKGKGRKGKAAVAARSQIMPPFVATAKIPTKKKERKKE